MCGISRFLQLQRRLDRGGAHQVGQVQLLRDAHARAVELAHDVCVVTVTVLVAKDEVRGPDEGQGLALQPQGVHHLVDVAHPLLHHLGKLLVVGLELGVGSAGLQGGGQAALGGLLVHNLDALGPDHQAADLALHNARAEALVHQLAAGRLTALEVLAGAGAGPGAALGVAPVHAKLEELADGVLLDVVVVGLSEHQHLVVAQQPVAERLAVVAVLQLDDPDALTLIHKRTQTPHG
eukprot:1193156-Prorocentrum_minimum.AAC.5